MKKITSLLLICLFLLAVLPPLAVLPATAKGTDPVTVSYRSPAIPASVGDIVDLSRYTVEFTESTSASGSAIK